MTVYPQAWLWSYWFRHTFHGAKISWLTPEACRSSGAPRSHHHKLGSLGLSQEKAPSSSRWLNTIHENIGKTWPSQFLHFLSIPTVWSWVRVWFLRHGNNILASLKSSLRIFKPKLCFGYKIKKFKQHMKVLRMQKHGIYPRDGEWRCLPNNMNIFTIKLYT